MDLHQRGAGFLLERRHAIARLVAGRLKDELAGERVAVGVQAGGRQTDDNVTGTDIFSSDQLVAVHNADDEAGKIVFPVGVEAGHLRRLAADERAAVLLACRSPDR